MPSELDIAVAHVLGESVHEIRRRGFSWADPLIVDFDPEPSELPSDTPAIVDWDELDAQRVRLFP